MIDKIIDRITTYSASVSKPVNVIEFGAGSLPAPPYVVVKQEPDPVGRGTAFRIITHFAPDQQKALRNYVRDVIGTALDRFSATSDNGNYNELAVDFDAMPSAIIALNDDGTISSERLYYMGDRIY